jgi:hypothetical protein
VTNPSMDMVMSPMMMVMTMSTPRAVRTHRCTIEQVPSCEKL